jgi:hypothetical protein
MNTSEVTCNGLPFPSDYPMGSPESRAAARAMAERKIRTRITVRIVHVGQSLIGDLATPYRIDSEDSVVEFVHTGGNNL